MSPAKILILHGWNLESSRFLPLVSELEKKKFKVYSPDLPGFGNSPLGKKFYCLDDYVDFVLSYLEKNKLKRINIIGHSFGGRIAVKLAAFHPEKVEFLVLTGVPGVLPVKRIKVLFFYFLAKTGKLLFSIPLLSNLRNNAQKLIYRAAGASDFYNTQDPLRETFQAVVKEKLDSYLSLIKSPVLLLWGGDDKIVPLFVAEKMNKLIPGSKLTVIGNTRHSLPFSHPHLFVREVEKFFKSEI